MSLFQTIRPEKRKTPPTSLVNASQKKVIREKNMPSSGPVAAVEKKRTRTGCNICRERHLKCDEGKPHCSQCIKRKRTDECNYGLQLKFSKFLDVRQPPYLCPVKGPYPFKDESVDIASEYAGGEELYALHRESQDSQRQTPPPLRLRSEILGGIKIRNDYHNARAIDSPLQSSNSAHSRAFPSGEMRLPTHFSPAGSSPQTLLSAPGSAMLHFPHRSSESQLSPFPQDYMPIEDPIDQHFMEVFINEMAAWMDTMNAINYFSGNLPYESTTQPVLYNAFLACGAAHQHMVHPDQWSAEYHKQYHAKATHLFEQGITSIENGENVTPEYKSVLAKASTVLAVYSTLVGGVPARIKALITGMNMVKGCGWGQTSLNSEGACYWLLRGIELLTSLNFRVRDKLDHAEDANLGFNFGKQRESMFNMESLWARKIIGIVSKIIDETGHDPNKELPPLPIQHWKNLSTLIDGWYDATPRTMLPLLNSAPRSQSHLPNISLPHSYFPKMWFQNMASTFAQIIFHTGWLVLLKYHPPPESMNEQSSLRAQELSHARSICGIAKCVKSRPLASVILRPCFIAAECLEDWNEQDEAFAMLEDFKRQTGWPIAKMLEKLRAEKWGRSDAENMQDPSMNLQHSEQMQGPHFDTTMLNQAVGSGHQIHIQHTMDEAQMQGYSTAPPVQANPGQYYSTGFRTQVPQTTPQGHQFHDPSQYLGNDEASQDLVASIIPARRNTIVEYQPDYPASTYGAHPVSNYPTFAPASSSGQGAFLNMTTNEAYQPSYPY